MSGSAVSLILFSLFCLAAFVLLGTRPVIRKPAKVVRLKRYCKPAIERKRCAHEWQARVSEAGDDFTSCNKCGAHAGGIDAS